MKQFEVGKKYKFDMNMKQEFFDAHKCNEQVFYDLAQFDYEITVTDTTFDKVSYRGGDYFLYPSDIEFFFLVVDVPVEQENVVSNKSESEIVKAWFDKVEWLLDNTPIKLYTNLEIVMENQYTLCNAGSVDFVINSYEAYQNKAKQQQKQLLLDKKKALELELAQINEQLEV